MPPITSIMDASYAPRKALSDRLSLQIIENNNLRKDLEEIIRVEDDEKVRKAKCECCGLYEEYTEKYINKVKESHSGRWVCGLCSEAVGEMIRRSGAPYAIEMKEALEKQRDFFQEFNGTTRVNPKLALTSTMRKIARRSSEYNREVNSKDQISRYAKIGRSSSCMPRMN